MRLNHKQEELIEYLFNTVKAKYPEIVLKDLSVSPDDRDHIWINVIADMDEDKESEMTYYAAGLEADIDIDYGYRISIMPENPRVVIN